VGVVTCEFFQELSYGDWFAMMCLPDRTTPASLAISGVDSTLSPDPTDKTVEESYYETMSEGLNFVVKVLSNGEVPTETLKFCFCIIFARYTGFLCIFSYGDSWD